MNTHTSHTIDRRTAVARAAITAALAATMIGLAGPAPAEAYVVEGCQITTVRLPSTDVVPFAPGRAGGPQA